MFQETTVLLPGVLQAVAACLVWNALRFGRNLVPHSFQKDCMCEEEMMADDKTCPSCNKEIKASTTVCPQCREQLEIVVWEIELASGDCLHHSQVEAIREDLLSGKFQLSDRCRQYKDVLVQINDGQKQYDKIDETKWHTVKDFADREFLLLSLYDPRKAYGQRAQEITGVLVGSLVAVYWIASGLMAAGANPVLAIVLSVILLLSTFTVIGLFVAGHLIGNAYGIPLLGLVIVAFIVGIVAGIATGFTVGRWIGLQIGSRKPKLIAV
jgi:hypothetical protein